MICNKCGNKIKDNNSIFCSSCGIKLGDNTDNIITNSNVNNQKNKDDSNTFLILGIILSLCCSLPFGVAIILINELKYKKLLNDGLLDEANKYKTIMIVLSVIGFLFFIGMFVFQIVLSILEALFSTGSYV